MAVFLLAFGSIDVRAAEPSGEAERTVEERALGEHAAGEHAVQTRPVTTRPVVTRARNLLQRPSGPGEAIKAAPNFPFALGDLPAQGVLTITYEVTVDAVNTWTNFPVTQICNQATVTANNHGNVLTDDPDTGAVADTTCTPVDSTDLRVTKVDGTDPVIAGNNLTYTITVTNDGPRTATGISVVDTLPAGVTFVSTAGCTNSPGSAAMGMVTCTLADIASSSSRMFTLTVTVDSSTTGMLTNSVTVSATTAEADPSDNTDTEVTTVSTSADLSITKTDTGFDPVVAGNTLVYTVTATNNGPSDAVGVVVTDTLPSDVTLDSAPGCTEAPVGTLTCNVGALAAGDNAAFTVTVTVDPGATGTLSNIASVSATTPDPDTMNNMVTETTTVDTSADLSITKTDTGFDPVVAGNTLVYTVTATNDGPSDATGVVVTDMLPSEVVLDSAPGCTEAPVGTLTCNVGTLAVGDNAAFTVTVTVDSGTSGTITNTASVSSSTADPDNGNDSTSEDTEVTIDDVEPPTVTNVDTVQGTGDGTLSECETAHFLGIQSLLVTFSEAMQSDNLPGSAAVPTSYALVSPGADRTFQVGDCLDPAGDDVFVDVTVDYDVPSRTATLNVAGGLPDELYRFLVCATTSDTAGNDLDGDDNGTGGDGFVRNFRLDSANRFANGHFDCDIAEWNTISTNPAEIAYANDGVGGDDFEGSPHSGSARVENLTASNLFGVDQCVPVEAGGEYMLQGWLNLAADPNVAVAVSRFCDFLDAPSCGGTSLGTTSDGVLAFDTGGFIELQSAVEAPEGAVSALCGFSLTTAGGESFVVNLDALFFGGDVPLFRDGFESGDTSMWSGVVP